ESVCAVVASRVPEVTTIPVPETDDGSIDVKALDVVAPRLDRFNAMAIGPGLGTHPSTVEFVQELIGRAPRMATVVDADGLNAFRDAPDALAERGNRVLTPHVRELARLMGQSESALEADRVASARAAAERFGGVVVFKGAGTVISGPPTRWSSGAIYVNPTGDSGLAQGGTGDVLTGLLAAFLTWSNGYNGAVGARVVADAVWLHGRAADRIAARLAPHTANATMLIDEIGPTMHEVCA
ncbi:MAG TPA: NAD(P)H-hydrate dehydratase, partial [Actinomycetota bacterium]|nr:NAD(P)H-hydrate dehydratase [Actinomycetota bacterium]